MNCPAPAAVVESVRAQLAYLQATQAASFAGIISDHTRCAQRCRELQVRLGQLDKEAAELRDENAVLSHRLAKFEDAAAQDWKGQAQAAQASLAELQKEVTGLYRDKARLLEGVVGANSGLAAAKTHAEGLAAQLATASSEVQSLSQKLSALQEELAKETEARVAASSELQAAFETREMAVVEAEKLRSENAALVRRLVELKEKEIDRMNEINRMHEEMLAQANMVQREAAADREAAEMIRQRAGSAAAAAAAAGAAGAAPGSGAGSSPGVPQQQQQAAAAAGSPSAGSTFTSLVYGAVAAVGAAVTTNRSGGVSLKDTMALPSGPSLAAGASDVERSLPKQPYRVVPAAHKGGCCSIALQSPGHLAASCGMDRVVAMWDLHRIEASAGSSATLQGMTAAVTDVAFTCDGQQLLGAGADKSLRLWDVASGQTRHTLTGHSGPVSCVATSPLDNRLAVSCGEDRTIKLWDLSRGFSARSVPLTKMPNALAVSRDGNTLITGHLDGSVCLWDVRQCRSGGTTPIAEARDHASIITGLTTTASDSLLLVAAKDSSISLWDFRVLSTQRILKSPQFSVGTIGSMGRGRCHVDMSGDGRWVAAGGADGNVYVWDLVGSAAAAAADGGFGRSSMGFGRDSYIAGHAAGGGESCRLSVLRGNAATGPSSQITHKDAVIAASWNADSSVLMTADKAGGVAFWSMIGL